LRGGAVYTVDDTRSWAEAVAVSGGKIVFVLEGGYDPANVANGAGAVFAALAGTRAEFDAGDPCPRGEPEVESRLDEVRRWHGF